MVVYLDNSFLNRPFDDPEVGINKLESEVLSLILELVKASKADIVNSSVIEYENLLNPVTERKALVKEILKGSKLYQNVDAKTKKRAQFLTQEMMLSPIDALHLATAEQATADIFITCDYGIIKKYKGGMKTINPLEFLKYYENSIK